MRQRSLDNMLNENEPFRYSFGFNYDSDKGNEALVHFVHTRFEEWNICAEECGKTGLRHLQCYGETKVPISKSERQMFQGNGRYRKYLNETVTKRYWFKDSRKERQVNVMYILKDVKSTRQEERVIELNPHHDVIELLDWIEQAHKMYHEGPAPVVKEPTNYQDRLFYWYRDLPLDERPLDVLPLIKKMLECNMWVWNNLSERQLVNSAEAILIRCTQGEDRSRVIGAKLARCEEYYRNKF